MLQQSEIDQTIVETCLRNYQFLLNYQYNFAIEWQELADYILPRKNSILVQRIPGWKRTQKLFDSTASEDLEKLAASIHSTLTPSFTKWFHLEMEDQELNGIHEVRIWLDKATKIINSALNKSNFNSEAHETFIDLIGFGTACLYEEEGSDRGYWGGLRFTSVPIGKYVASEDKDGRVNTIYRSFPMPIHAIIEKWGDSVPNDVKQSDKPNTLMEVIHGVYPVPDAKSKKWESIYILFKHRTLLSKKGYYSFPYLVPRWTKYSDETYGRGPSHTALPDIRTLNKLVEMELRALAKVVDPPLGVVGMDIIGPARMVPGGLTTVRNKDAIFAINTGTNFQVTNLTKEGLREQIHSVYMIDQLQLQTGPQMTATEVNTRFELMQRILGPVLGRLEAEFTKPLLERTFTLMYKAGLFEPLPTAFNRIKNKIMLKIQYKGSLARAQRASDVNAITQFEQLIEPIGKIKPEAIEVVDWDGAVRHVAEILDVPANIIRDEKEMETIRQAEQQELQKQQQAQQAEQLSQTGKNVAPLLRTLHDRPKPGSIMSKVA